MDHRLDLSQNPFLTSRHPFPLVRSEPLPHSDTFELFSRLTYSSSSPSFLLESGNGFHPQARFSFMGCSPYMTLSGKGHRYDIRTAGQVVSYQGSPFQALASRLDSPAPQYQSNNLPFWGGAVGFISYDLVRQFESLPEIGRDDLQLPDLEFLFVDLLAAIDHKTQTLYCIFTPPPNRLQSESRERLYQEGCERIKELEARLRTPLPKNSPRPEPAVWGPIIPHQSKDAYTQRVRQCQAYITSGDIYQANISHRFGLEFPQRWGHPRHDLGASLYAQLRRGNPSPFSALLHLDQLTLVSSSPERLVRLQNRQAETRPIAGTRPRGSTASEDSRLISQLQENPKERAEHLMLVDLARNDLGRVCSYGSIHVNELMTVEQYSHVAHLVSNVTGSLWHDITPAALLKAVFPGGTITGVPKIRCMEIIEELEPVRRGVYTGSIGYWGWNGNMDFNIVIRTILLTQGKGYIQVGAGIVADSIPEREYEETLHKAEAMFKAVQ